MNKKTITASIDKDVIRVVKITMAELELNNLSLLIESLLKEWTSCSGSVKW